MAIPIYKREKWPTKGGGRDRPGLTYAHAVFYANARELGKRTELRGRSGEDGVDRERRKKTELAIGWEGLTKPTKNLKQKGEW